jgi:antitoxin component of MazEF toxin-antitoxin module
MTVTAKKLGGSVAVLIPKAIAQEMGLSDGTALDITTASGAIIMRRQGRRPRRKLESITNNISRAAYRRRAKELSDARPVGKEIW